MIAKPTANPTNGPRDCVQNNPIIESNPIK